MDKGDILFMVYAAFNLLLSTALFMYGVSQNRKRMNRTNALCDRLEEHRAASIVFFQYHRELVFTADIDCAKVLLDTMPLAEAIDTATNLQMETTRCILMDTQDTLNQLRKLPINEKRNIGKA